MPTLLTEMFDSNLCDRTLTKLPLAIPWWQFEWLKPLLPVVGLLLVVSGLFWIIQNKKWRRWLTSPRGILLLFAFTASLPLMFVAADKALVAFLPRDSGVTADAIVLLGRGGGEFYEDRVNLAVELWQAKRAPMIFTSGNKDAPSMIEQLEEKGIPKRSLDGENCSLTTAENAVFSAAVLQPRGIGRIILITDEPHMLRSLLVYRALGFTVIPHTTPIPSYLDFKQSGFLTLREYMGLIGYGFRGLFLPQSSPEAVDPEIVHLVQKAKDYAQQRRIE